jgi:hypothetical protein
MADLERIAKLEGKVEALDKAIAEIKAEQSTARDCREEANITMSELNGKIDAVLTKLSESKQAKYKATDIILALGMIALTLMQYLK